MKKQLSLSIAFIILSSIFTFGFGQQEIQRSISGNGYWVVESNTKTPKISILYFYTNDNVLVYKEHVQGIKIKINKRKVVNRLNNVLEQSLIAWKQQNLPAENRMLVTYALKQ
ncbi:MAG: hypothetical protein ACM3VS_05340 [Candidatus Dadabacteria bacterium]